jgi:hypothetical protein
MIRALVWSLIGLPLVAVIMIALGFYLIVRKLAVSQVDEYVPGDMARDPKIARTADAKLWAEQNRFQFIGYHVESCMNSLIVAWQHPSQPTYFCAYVVSDNARLRNTYDFVTMFERDVSLTTGSTKDGHMMPPRPGAYVQTFSQVSLDEQWRRHTEAERFLTSRGHVRYRSNLPPFVESITTAIHGQVAHVRSLPFWPFRGVFWFASRRTRWHDLSIQEQHEAGRIRLPHELAART